MKKNKIEARKWEALPMDCLVNVFGRLEVEDLLVDVPFVCKSWYKATFDPLCWKQLDFPCYDDYVVRFKRQYRAEGDKYEQKSQFNRRYGLEGDKCLQKSPFERRYGIRGDKYEQRSQFNRRYRVMWDKREQIFVKGVIDRSAGCATMVNLRYSFSEKVLINYIADKCPALKKLVLWPENESVVVALSLVIGKFKNLVSLEIETVFLFKEIVTEIGSYCKNFVALYWNGGEYLDWITIGEEEVMAVVTCLPRIECLTLTGVLMERENLIKILKGCVDLVYLDVRYCVGFEENDEELLKLASHIPTFECSGSHVNPFASKLAFFFRSSQNNCFG